MQPTQFSPTDDIIDICYDNVFKAAFTSDTPGARGALKNLLSAILEQDVAALRIISNEPPVNDLRDRQIRFDIAVEFSDGRLADVEMTLHPGVHEHFRIEYYASRFYVTQDIRGIEKDYGDLRHTYQISLVGQSLFKDTSFFHHFEYYDKEREISLNGQIHIVVLELSKVGELAEKPVSAMNSTERWSLFFRYCTDPKRRELINELFAREEGISMAGQSLLTLSKNEVERIRLESEIKYMLDRQSEMAEARKAGLAKGLAEGRQAGLVEGHQETQGVIAKNALAKGLPMETISEITGLDLEAIEKLAKE
jgi:predicted transposase/invertase (TIGR01784 family)